MLRTRKFSLAGIALGSIALSVSLTVPPAYGHGYTNGPISRAKHCQNGTVQNCGPIQWEPQSVEGPKGFPNGGPADGQLCSGGLSQFSQLNDQRNGAWPATSVSAGPRTISWYLTAPHSTTDFKYYMTKQGWNRNAPLTRSALDLTPFHTHSMGGARPANNVSHQVTLPSGRTGRHMILAVWTIADTGNAFYQCSDVVYPGAEKASSGTPVQQVAQQKPAPAQRPAGHEAFCPHEFRAGFPMGDALAGILHQFT